MNKTIRYWITGVLCAAVLGGAAVASGLAEGDSLITLSYLEQLFIPKAVEQGTEHAASALDGTYQTAGGALDSLAEEYLQTVGAGTTGGHSSGYARRTYRAMDVITLETGAGLMVESGSVRLSHSGTVVDVSAGVSVADDTLLAPGHRYLVAEDTRADFTVESDAARIGLEGYWLLVGGSIPASPFTDITIHDWYRDAVRQVYERGLFAGTGDGSIFAPKVKLDRSMMMTVLFHLAGDPEQERADARATFPDVPADQWYESYVRWAGQQGISAGYGDGNFRPLQTMTRREIVQFLYNFARSYLKLELTEQAALDGMAGVEILRADGWGEEAMSWAVGAGIISELRPNDCPDRGEVAAIVAGFANKYYPAEAPN